MSKLKSALSVFNLNSKKKKVTAVALTAAILTGSNLAYQESTMSGTFQSIDRIETTGSQVCAIETLKTDLIGEVPVSKSKTVDAATKKQIAAELRSASQSRAFGTGPSIEEPTVTEKTSQESVISSKCSSDISYTYHTKYRGELTNTNSLLQLKFNSKEIEKDIWEKGSFSFKIYKPFPWSEKFNILTAKESSYQSSVNKNNKDRHKPKPNDSSRLFN